MSATPTIEELPARLSPRGEVSETQFRGGRWPLDGPREGMRWTSCEFHDCNFSSAQLSELSATGCSFIRCSFRLAGLAECSFAGCTFYDSEASEGCAFALADLEAAHFSECNLNMCDFSRARLYRVEIEQCQAQGACLRNAAGVHEVSDRVTLASARIRHCNLAYADLTGANLRECDLSGSRMNHATLDDACLAGANLSECDLTAIEAHHLELVGADLRNAMIAGLDVRKIDLHGVRIMEWQQRHLLETLGMEILAD